MSIPGQREDPNIASDGGAAGIVEQIFREWRPAEQIHKQRLKEISRGKI